MSRAVRKPDFCLCKNKGADQLRSNCEADQRPVADLEGVQGVHSNPPLDPNYFIFIGHFKRFCVKPPLFI